MALGLWIGRRVRGASDFFVAGRRLGPGLIFSTMLAANIGAGSTVGATSRGYIGRRRRLVVGRVGRDRVADSRAVDRSGDATASAARGLHTVGDYLEFRYSRTVRGVIAALLWIGSIFILARS